MLSIIQCIRKWFTVKARYKPLPADVTKVCDLIAEYYSTRFPDSIDSALEHIYRLRIEKIEVVSGRAVIHTRRPGLLIGRMGKDYDGLSKLIGEFKIVEVMSNDFSEIIACACRRLREPNSGYDPYHYDVFPPSE